MANNFLSSATHGKPQRHKYCIASRDLPTDSKLSTGLAEISCHQTVAPYGLVAGRMEGAPDGSQHET